jgi:hypothetical protein
MPTQFNAKPASRSQVVCVRSNQRPSRGWRIDDVRLKTIATRPARRYERPNNAVRTGRRPEIRLENVSLTVCPITRSGEKAVLDWKTSEVDSSGSCLIYVKAHLLIPGNVRQQVRLFLSFSSGAGTR